MKTPATVVALLLVLASAAPAWGQTPSAHPSRVRQTALFLTGAAAGLAVHESGHLIFGAALGAHPRVRPLDYGPIPFFKIAHDPVTRRREFVISSAGFWMQHGGSEWLLAAKPRLCTEPAPFWKGLFAFNVGASLVYSVAAFGRIGPPERDTRGIAASLGKDGIAEPVVGLLVLAPAVLDVCRCLNPEARWAAWLSRGVKIAGVALTLAARD